MLLPSRNGAFDLEAPVSRRSLLTRLGFWRPRSRSVDLPNAMPLAEPQAQVTPQSTGRFKRHGRRSRTVLLSVLLGYLGIQIAFILWADTRKPGMYDPEFYGRVKVLDQRRAEHPDQPMLLVFGSSRVVNLFRPERLEPVQTADGQQVLVFNFSHTVAGPTYMYLSYRRLVEKGAVPRWVVLEIMPMIARKQDKNVYAGGIVASEFPWLAGQHETDDLAVEYLKTRLLPWERLRSPIMYHFMPCIDVSPPSFVISGDYEDLGGLRLGTDAVASDPEGMARQIRDSVATKGPLMVTFKPDPRGERSLQALLEMCRQHGTKVAFLLSPESPAFRLYYTAEAYRQVGDYYSQMASEWGAPFVDAREWLDESDFSDGHHAVYSGQAKFTERLANELLRDWVKK